MMSEEDNVIDGVGGRPQGPRPVAANSEATTRAVAEVARGAEVSTPAVRDAAVSSLARIAKELAASPPVDGARVEALRLAIASGDYKPDPQRIAAAMIALETPPKA
jgi:negative regulator of flagellin synthesis FlgM